MDLSMLKTQVMTMFMMRPAVQGGATGGNKDIFSLLYGMLLMNIVEQIFKFLPGVGAFLSTWLSSKTGVTKHGFTLLDKKAEKTLNSIAMTRVFMEKPDAKDKSDNVYVEKVDAILDFICNLDNAKHVRLDTRYSLNTMEDIELTPMLKAKVKQMTNGEEEQIIELLLFSSVLKVSEIRQWIDEIHENYMFEKNNKLGNKIFYFSEIPSEPLMQQEMMPDGTQKKTYRWENLPKILTFHMNEFKTSKSFSNVYGNHVDELKERLDLFIHHPDWYMDRGIPHSLGIMLHGVPGSGKTSTIKAIARDTHRHIFSLSLRPYTTQRQLTSLFFNETVVVHTYDGAKLTYKIPLNRRVYVIEDIDCLSDVVLDRSLPRQNSHDTKEGESITLSFLLNLLDGVLETPGRILIITTNFPDKLDKALVRPGRIDVKIEFTNASRAFIMDMITKFYNVSISLSEIPVGLDGVFTPAEVMESMCMFFKDAHSALAHLERKRSLLIEAAQGTLVENLEPPTMEVKEEPKVVLAFEEVLAKKEGDGVFRMGDVTWTCASCKEVPSIMCPTCRDMTLKASVKVDQQTVKELVAPLETDLGTRATAEFGDDLKPPENIGSSFTLLAASDMGDFASCNFLDAPFLDPSAAMPGTHPFSVRAAVDLNQM